MVHHSEPERQGKRNGTEDLPIVPVELSSLVGYGMVMGWRCDA